MKNYKPWEEMKLKKLIMLFLLVSFMCFGEDKVESKKSYEVVQREEIDFLKTQLMKSNNKIDDLSKKVEKLEYKKIEKITYKDDKGLSLVYNVDQIYQNSMQYYDKTIELLKWLIGGMLLVLGYLKWDGNKKYEKEKQEITKELDKRMERMLTENKELKEKIVEQEQGVERKTLELDKKIKTVEFNTELGIAINKSEDEEKIEELKKLLEKYPKKINIYIELGFCLINKEQYEEAIENFNKVNEIEPEDASGHCFIGYAYEVWGENKEEKNNSKAAKQYFELAMENYKKSIKLKLSTSDLEALKERIEKMKEKLEELKDK